ncbi:MAG: M48 family metalloprotease [Deltaproteobacteria bacterium]|nr:M48 family metalloprotease [Deltaproteobacteria bacterium]
MTFSEIVHHPHALATLKCVLVNAVPVLFYAIWGSTFLEELAAEEADSPGGKLSDEDRATWLRQIRVVYSFTVLGQILAYAVCYELAPMPYHLGWLVFLVALVIQGQLRFGLEKRLRRLEATQSQGLGRTARTFLAFIGMLGVYSLIVHAVSLLFLAGARAFHLSDAATTGCQVVGSFAGVFLAIGVAFVAAPIYLRRLLPAKRLEDSKLINQLDRCFLDAGIVPPEFWQLELDHFGLHSAMAAGMTGWRGWLRPALFLSRSLLRDFSAEERQAVILHEISHLKLRHLRARFLTTFFSLFGSCVAAGVLIGLAALVFPKPVLPLIALSVALLPALVPFVLVRRQVLAQEFEADEYAVFKLGASLDGLAGALRRLDRLNDQALDPEAAAQTTKAPRDAQHPGTESRIKRLRDRAARTPGSEAKPDDRQAA